jgi:hypothetical protein
MRKVSSWAVLVLAVVMVMGRAVEVPGAVHIRVGTPHPLLLHCCLLMKVTAMAM